MCVTFLGFDVSKAYDWLVHLDVILLCLDNIFLLLFCFLLLFFGCLFQGLYWGMKLCENIVEKTQKAVYFGHIHGSLIINGFSFCYSALCFIHLMLPHIRGAIFSSHWDAAFTHKLQLFKNKLPNCQHGLLTKCVFWGAWTFWIFLVLWKLMVHLIELHFTVFSRQSLLSCQCINANMDWEGVKVTDQVSEKDRRKIKEGIQFHTYEVGQWC